MEVQLHENNFSTFRRDSRPTSSGSHNNNSQNADVLNYHHSHSHNIRANLNGIKKDSVDSVTVHLSCQPHSHAFQERWIPLPQSASGSGDQNKDGTTQQPLKVGRLVAKMKPAVDNAIFDCKVLSRNHALLWRDDEGRVWLKDTKSSNGTFVNGQRLSKGTEESAPRELKTGDIVQFGVEVVENQLTHGCIIAQISLYEADGTERKRRAVDGKEEAGGGNYLGGFINSNATGPLAGMGLPGSGSLVTQEQLYMICHYLQEAAHRESALENKMVQLQNLLNDITDSSQSTWNLVLNEEKLLMKVKSLEETLAIYTSNNSDDIVKAQLLERVEICQTLEKEYEELLQSSGEEKLSLMQRLRESESQYKRSTDECFLLQQQVQKMDTDFHDLTRLYEEHDRKLTVAKQKTRNLKERCKSHDIAVNAFNKERDTWRDKELKMQSEIQNLKRENDEYQKQLIMRSSNVSVGTNWSDYEDSHHDHDAKSAELDQHGHFEKESALDEEGDSTSMNLQQLKIILEDVKKLSERLEVSFDTPLSTGMLADELVSEEISQLAHYFQKMILNDHNEDEISSDKEQQHSSSCHDVATNTFQPPFIVLNDENHCLGHDDDPMPSLTQSSRAASALDGEEEEENGDHAHNAPGFTMISKAESPAVALAEQLDELDNMSASESEDASNNVSTSAALLYLNQRTLKLKKVSTLRLYPVVKV